MKNYQTRKDLMDDFGITWSIGSTIKYRSIDYIVFSVFEIGKKHLIISRKLSLYGQKDVENDIYAN